MAAARKWQFAKDVDGEKEKWKHIEEMQFTRVPNLYEFTVSYSHDPNAPKSTVKLHGNCHARHCAPLAPLALA